MRRGACSRAVTDSGAAGRVPSRAATGIPRLARCAHSLGMTARRARHRPAFSFSSDHVTGHGAEIQIVDFGNGVQGVYLYIGADKLVDSIINVVSDHALTAADFVL